MSDPTPPTPAPAPTPTPTPAPPAPAPPPPTLPTYACNPKKGCVKTKGCDIESGVPCYIGKDECKSSCIKIFGYNTGNCKDVTYMSRGEIKPDQFGVAHETVKACKDATTPSTGWTPAMRYTAIGCAIGFVALWAVGAWLRWLGDPERLRKRSIKRMEGISIVSDAPASTPAPPATTALATATPATATPTPPAMASFAFAFGRALRRL